MRPGDVMAGVRAAFEAPAWTEPRRLARLMAPNGGPAARRTPPRAAPTDSLRVSRGALRLLGRFRVVGGPWRNTCLYRAIAGCLVLRRRGIPATLRLGARSDPARPDPVTAHAWVEAADGSPLVEAPQDHTPLR